MSVDGNTQSISVAASADLSALQFKAVQLDGTLADTNKEAGGLLQNKPQLGEHANIAYSGHMKGVAGAALSVNDDVKVSSGFLIAVASGDTSRGKVVTAATSGSMVEVVAAFNGGYTHTYSAG